MLIAVVDIIINIIIIDAKCMQHFLVECEPVFMYLLYLSTNLMYFTCLSKSVDFKFF